jgi:putative nucleotidyltransferase with HDIG domain
MSSGKKRRTTSEGVMTSKLDQSALLRYWIYGLFSVLVAILVSSAPSGSPFYDEPAQGVLVVTLALIMALVAFETTHVERSYKNGHVLLLFGGLFAHLAMVRAVSLIVESNKFDESLKLLVIPFAFAPIIHSVLLGRAVGVYSTVLVSVVGCFIVPQGQMLSYLVVSVLCGLTGVYLTHDLRKRGRLLRAGLYVGAIALVMAYAFDAISIGPLFAGGTDAWTLFAINSAAAFGCGVVTGMVVSGLLPLLEGLFSITTDITWLELGDLNHKLLRKMQLEAPGTFHHSMVVASLAEAAAEQIGANAMVCRVSSYFHDIGKLSKPEYFIENQGEINPHDCLTPTMSALIIVAHVKDGVDLAIKHKLNPRIVDVIREHHGDSLVYYFYRKAQEKLKDEEAKVKDGLENPEDLPSLDEKCFRYPGPRPRTRESGIVSLADAIESASRSLRKATPQKISSLVDDIVYNRIRDGQLDYCGLSVSDLRVVRKSFSSTLRSMLHSRIDYPQAGKPERGEERKSELEASARVAGRFSENREKAENVVSAEVVERHRRKLSGDS